MNKNKIVYLVGMCSSQISGRKLPSNRQVMSLFFYKYYFLKKSVTESSIDVSNDVINIWSPTGIILIQSQFIIKKIEKLYYEWKNLKKSSSRKKSPTQKHNEQNYCHKLDDLFNVSSKSNELTDHQKQMLNYEKNQNRCLPVSPDVDDPIISTQNSDEDNAVQELSRTMSNVSVSSEELSRFSSHDSNVSLKRTISNFEDEIPRHLKLKKTKLNVMTSCVTSTLDRTKLSSRQAAHLMCAFAGAMDADVKSINCSARSIHRHRKQLRSSIVHKLKKNLQSSPSLVLHWDGKLLPDDDLQKVERLSIIVSVENTEQLLGVPKLHPATGIKQATAIVDILDDWQLESSIKAICFDTTSVNTGEFNGTCHLLEKKLDKNLLYFACRHHIYELVLRSAAETCWSVTNSPNVPIFTRFKNHWSEIDQERIEVGVQDDFIYTHVKDEKKKYSTVYFRLN